jgi:hypothetical protein
VAGSNNVKRVASVCHVHPSRAFYFRCWRLTTKRDWRKANRDSRQIHLAERKAYDHRRYWARRLAVLHAEALRHDAWLTEKGFA